GTIKHFTLKPANASPIIFPGLSEQQKIGAFFKELDKTIALHQRKLTLLKQLKQTYLQALFPQSELNIPTLRFARFSDSWEHRKVSSLAKETFGGGTPKTGVKKYWKGSFPWIQSSDLTTNQLHNVQPTKFITEEAIKQSATHNVPGNSIAIVTRVGVGKLALMRSSYSTSQDFLSLSNLNVDAVFGVYCLYKMLQREVNNIQGTSIKGITKADLLGKCVSVPTKVEEQVKIGAFFKKIDDTIDFHESKLKHILELKKAFLEKMFL
ncbi:MAG: restriction endonuclease subunit S, partial [Enterococcus aquimarinus]